MNYISGLYTDVGIKKKTNQDSMLLQHANTEYGEAVLAVMCDGMGGLKKGEVASADVVLAFSKWFKEVFPGMIKNGSFDPGALRQSWLDLINDHDSAISRFGSINGINLGTTLCGILIFANRYYVVNIGDSRAYLLSNQIFQLTHDHTAVQERIDRGEITIEQSLLADDRSVLLQCIGASDYVKPDFFAGDVQPNNCFLLCCDGFRHMITPSEIYAALNASKVNSQQAIEAALKTLTDTVKYRRETDNISAILVKAC